MLLEDPVWMNEFMFEVEDARSSSGLCLTLITVEERQRNNLMIRGGISTEPVSRVQQDIRAVSQ